MGTPRIVSFTVQHADCCQDSHQNITSLPNEPVISTHNLFIKHSSQRNFTTRQRRLFKNVFNSILGFLDTLANIAKTHLKAAQNPTSDMLSAYNESNNGHIRLMYSIADIHAMFYIHCTKIRIWCMTVSIFDHRVFREHVCIISSSRTIFDHRKYLL